MTGPAGARRVAVLDVGKTNVKLVLFDGAGGAEAWARTAPNAVRRDGPYPHVDTERLKTFFLDGLADLVRAGGFDAISITAHGATGALIGPQGLTLPILDYEHDGPDELAEAYARQRPAFSESFSPRLPGGLNLGAQLFWQQGRFAEAFDAADAILTYPQYWAWWLTGVAATEPTSLGTHTDLWAPAPGHFSSLVEKAGWTGRMAPIRSAFDALGPVRPELAQRIGLRTPVPVCCGIHDSNASLLPHIQGRGEPLAVVSTGTWAIVFAPGGSLGRLDPARDTLANVDAYRRPVPSARFMGGREFDLLTGGQPVDPDAGTVADVVARGVMALPSFAPGTGPFPAQAGRWSHHPAGLTAPERSAAAGLYAALMTATCLDLLGAGGTTVIEGPFARNRLFCDALAALTDRPVAAARSGTGTSAGAARLALPQGAAAPRPAAGERVFEFGPDFKGYAAAWRRALSASGSSL